MSYRVALALLVLASCSSLPAPESPEVAQAKLRACQVAAFVPVTGDARKAAEFVHSVRDGKASIVEMLNEAGATADQIYVLTAELRACQIAHAGTAE